MPTHPVADAYFRAAVPILEEFALRHRLTVDKLPRYVSGDAWWRNASGAMNGRQVCFQLYVPDPSAAPPWLVIRFWIWFAPGFPDADGWWCGGVRLSGSVTELAAKLDEARLDAERVLRHFEAYAPRGHPTRIS
jgi:hypothetical protein